MIRPIDLARAADSEALVALLDHYARDPLGGGEPLSASVKATLARRLETQPHYHGALAWQGNEAVGLINCFTGFSTFKAAPLLNIHDLIVGRDWRGRGIGRALLAWAEQCALELGCCKLTLEVLSNNVVARAAYLRAGYRDYQLDPTHGSAQLMQRWLT